MLKQLLHGSYLGYLIIYIPLTEGSEYRFTARDHFRESGRRYRRTLPPYLTLREYAVIIYLIQPTMNYILL